MPIGCGVVGCLTLVVIFAAGFYLMKNAPKVMAWALTRIEREVDRLSEPSVTVEQRAELKRQLARLRVNLGRGEKEGLPEAQSVLFEMNRAIGDQRLTAEEVEQLTRHLRELNDRIEKKPAAQTVVGCRLSVEPWRSAEPTTDNRQPATHVSLQTRFAI